MQIRQLEPHEWDILKQCKWLEDRPIPGPESATAIVALGDENELLGVAFAQIAVTLEPVWVTETARGTGLAPLIWKQLEDTVREWGKGSIMSHASSEETAAYLERLGFAPTGWELYQKEI